MVESARSAPLEWAPPRRKAGHYYARFVELWKDCDPELRPQVDEARRRLAKLSADSGT